MYENIVQKDMNKFYTAHCSIKPGRSTKMCFVIRCNEAIRLFQNENPNGIWKSPEVAAFNASPIFSAKGQNEILVSSNLPKSQPNFRQISALAS